MESLPVNTLSSLYSLLVVVLNEAELPRSIPERSSGLELKRGSRFRVRKKLLDQVQCLVAAQVACSPDGSGKQSRASNLSLGLLCLALHK